ncbi:unnamed protein product [Mytilus edulis]|uniref:DUF4097 domain-containing protein n=1 Tax=Mytilus edulis TaxID=6550 RepID=A0A8S3R4B9_MYTED|nr:unnamed protein product [Mytilus edulis]
MLQKETVPVNQSDGDVPVSQTDGDVPVSLKDGDVHISQSPTDGDVLVSQTDGDVHISLSVGDVPVSQSYGDVPVSQSDGDVPVSQSDGDVPVSQSDGDIPFSLSDGDNPISLADYDVCVSQSDKVPISESGGDGPFSQSDSSSVSENQMMDLFRFISMEGSDGEKIKQEEQEKTSVEEPSVILQSHSNTDKEADDQQLTGNILHDCDICDLETTRRILPYLPTWNLGHDVCLDAPIKLYNWIPYSVMMSRDVFVTFEHLVNDRIS